ncbi:alpha/beta fold hydrolase [uncultured Desulfovibrio sp.]|uniref:alpha/beta hydrolase n=1 Tax=uncultured Desulfovibrio sp. TaxID=167968 RepID=UPI002634F210|nr:alpha/beta fold hydrolase [uncultured Desulfovibrio sp.]
MNGAPFCLALHGLGGTPEELRSPLAALEAAGVRTEAPLLPGHGASEAAYLASSYADWRALALERYRARCGGGPILLLGYSLGGLLALEIVRRALRLGLPLPVGLIVLSTPLSFAVRTREARFFFRALPLLARLPLPGRLFPALRCPPRSAASREVAPWRGFETCLSLRHVLEMERASRKLRPWLGRCRMPLLFMQLRHDDRCPPANAAQWLENWGGPALVEVLTARSGHGGHLVPTHAESRDIVAARVADFARSALGLATFGGHR